MKDRSYIGRYEITATDPDGNAQQATFTCAGKITKTGYLVKRGAYEACLVAIAKLETRE